MKTGEAPVSAGDSSRPTAGTATILHTQRLSTEDGPGIRTTVFFKGCPLHCAWCHNPESISPLPQVQWMENRCIGCGACIKECPRGCLSRTPAGIVRDRALCTACGTCVSVCPSGAQETLGKTVDVEGLLAELLKDRVYYEKSGGGVTLSGGEPLLQPEFALDLLRCLKEQGISTAIDTCGFFAFERLERMLPYVDLVLYDLKETDNDLHRQSTGVENARIMNNLLLLRDYAGAHPGSISLWIRTPLIPGATANGDTVRRIGTFISANLAGTFSRWELCAFNNLCRDKYSRLGLEWDYQSTPLLTREELAGLEAAARQSGPNPDIIFATGATRVEE